MKKIFFATTIILGSILFTSFYFEKEEIFEVRKDEKVSEVLERLGDNPILHQPNLRLNGVSVKAGEQLALYGITRKPDGGKTKKQSKHFVCTSCHNIVKEDPDLRISDPQARLEYAKENNLPFLQGTSLYGIINRSTFYNGDYDKKYGELVESARNNIREAIQLCAVECSQGRRLLPWELESILAWLWSLELKMEDLNLTDADYQKINAALNAKEEKKEAIDLIKSYFLSGSPAHFVSPPEDRKKGYGLKADPENGKLIYELSCQHCHKNKRYSQFNLNNAKTTFQHLSKYFPKYSNYSIYQVGRYGTPPLNGKRAYMPQFTLEKMSNQQMEDLRAYIERESE